MHICAVRFVAKLHQLDCVCPGMAFEGSSIQYYRDRAKRIRERARQAEDPEAKAQLEWSADLFDQLADLRDRARLQ
jgi:hypothetical protein